MLKGFVFGKFLPFHKGHQAMIEFALTHCDYLTVLVCCSDKESIPSKVRVEWIKKTFEKRNNIELISFHYKEEELPNTSVSSKDISKLWADKFKTILPEHSLLVTSEPYGEFVAEFMNILHIPFDYNRQQIPISATNIRNDIFANWHFLPDSVKTSYCKKVVLLGTESTGKTTLTQQLAKHFNASYVLECGRDLIPNSNKFNLDDLYSVAREHANNIQQASIGNSPIVIIDTDIYITMSYANFALKQHLEVDEEIFKINKADLYLYLNNDVPHIQDGTRLSEIDRNLLDKSHRDILKCHHVSFCEIRGNWESRYELSKNIVKNNLLSDTRYGSK